MFKKRTSYEVNVQGITFWRKIINEDNTEVFVKSSLNESFMLYIDKVKGNEYLDWVIGPDSLCIPACLVHQSSAGTYRK